MQVSSLSRHSSRGSLRMRPWGHGWPHKGLRGGRWRCRWRCKRGRRARWCEGRRGSRRRGTSWWRSTTSRGGRLLEGTGLRKKRRKRGRLMKRCRLLMRKYKRSKTLTREISRWIQISRDFFKTYTTSMMMRYYLLLSLNIHNWTVLHGILQTLLCQLRHQRRQLKKNWKSLKA
jgi:hypothetical protein